MGQHSLSCHLPADKRSAVIFAGEDFLSSRYFHLLWQGTGYRAASVQGAGYRWTCRASDIYEASPVG